MVDSTPLLPGLSPVQGKVIVARFDGGRLSSEGGLLALRVRSSAGSASPIGWRAAPRPDVQAGAGPVALG